LASFGVALGRCCEEIVEPIERGVPEAALLVDPARCGLHYGRRERAAMNAAQDLPLEQPRLFKHADMPRDRRLRYGKTRCDLAYRKWSAPKPLDDLPSSRIAQGGEYRVEISASYNHNVI
jgi:hypothetical protein